MTSSGSAEFMAVSSLFRSAAIILVTISRLLNAQMCTFYLLYHVVCL